MENFNRQTNQFNSEGLLKAYIANAENRLKNSNLLIQNTALGARMRQAAKDTSDAAKSANLTNLFDSLGNIGWEEYQRNMLNNNPGLYYGIDRLGGSYYKNKTSKGGYLTIRRKK